MGLLMLNIAVVGAAAWVARAMLSAHEITWRRMIVAVLSGFSLGGVVGVLLLIDPAEVAGSRGAVDVPSSQIYLVSLPFQIIATMVAVVALELVSAAPPRRSELRAVRPIREIRRRVRIGVRALQVTRVVTRHGLAPLLGLKRGEVSTRHPVELARRTREALEEAGGMFVKLGQLLATRPDLLPPEALAELGRLHAAARPLSRDQVERVLVAEVASPEEVFEHVEWVPLGSASIAQAHAARLRDGRDVVVKVRRPGLEDLVERDLAIVLWLARIAERRTSWGRAFGVTALAREFADTLRAELDFRLEARAAMDMAAAVGSHHGIRVPDIVETLTSERVLVMERFVGPTLSALPPGTLGAADAADADRSAGTRALADSLCESQVGAMVKGERFHGDPHPGNVLLLSDSTLALIDFGVTGKLDAFERSAMFQMLVAIELEEPALLYESLVAVGAVSPAQPPEELERTLARFMATHLGAGLPPADALTELLRLMTYMGIRLPPQGATMFRALATLAGTLEHLDPGYPLIEKVAALGGAELRERMSPRSVGEFVQHEWPQLGPLLRRAPRHLDRLATMLEHGSVGVRVRLFTEAEDQRVVERLLNRALLSVLSLGVIAVSVLMLGTAAGPVLAGTEVRLVEVLGWFGLFAGTILLLRVLLAVLRTEVQER